MNLSQETTVKVNDVQSCYIGHMTYAACKLWNVCNYERMNYKELGLDMFPDWYSQKSSHKDDLWYKNLPSQTAQEVLKRLNEAWKSFFALKKSGGIQNPHPPKFKHAGIQITYIQNGIQHTEDTVRLTIPKALKKFMSDKFGLNEKYLYLKDIVFKTAEDIRQVTLYPPENGIMRVIVVYRVPDVSMLDNNGHYLSIDIGLHNLFTCYDSTGESFIAGRKYLSICRRFDKEISRVQSQWYEQQAAKGVKHPKTSKHIQALYKKKTHCIKDYLHKVTHAVTDYCVSHDIHTVVIGDITGIRKNASLGHKTNQKLQSLPYCKIYAMLDYKLAMHGISLVKQKEQYSSQCSPNIAKVNKSHAKPENRVRRGLYKDGKECFNADAVGAFNILRLYLSKKKDSTELPVKGIRSPYVLKVAV